MALVESKYKNPDKFIEQLKQRASKAEELRWEADRLAFRQHGTRVISWAPGRPNSTTCTSSSDLGLFRIGDEIITIGKVVKATEELVDGKPRSTVDYIRLETRRVPAWRTKGQS